MGIYADIQLDFFFCDSNTGWDLANEHVDFKRQEIQHETQRWREKHSARPTVDGL